MTKHKSNPLTSHISYLEYPQYRVQHLTYVDRITELLIVRTTIQILSLTIKQYAEMGSRFANVS